MSGRDLTELKGWLQTALELELATIPPYMMALLSIRLPGNRGVAERIRSVMVEEMLHMALVANVLNAIGGDPRLDAAATPRYPLTLTFEGRAFADRQFPVVIAPLSAALVDTFLKIELPRKPRRLSRLLSLTVPAPTIGEFYEKMIGRLEALDRSTRGGLFVGDRARQFEADYFWSGGGELIPVRNLADAVRALRLVADQGEGAWPRGSRRGAAPGFGSPFDMGHYYRFKEIRHARCYQPGDDPEKEPTGELLPVDFTAVYKFKPNPTGTDYPPGSPLEGLNLAFNRRYTLLLQALHEAMNGAPNGLYDAIMDHMHALTPIAHDMMKIPIPNDVEGLTGAPTFEWV